MSESEAVARAIDDGVRAFQAGDIRGALRAAAALRAAREPGDTFPDKLKVAADRLDDDGGFADVAERLRHGLVVEDVIGVYIWAPGEVRARNILQENVLPQYVCKLRRLRQLAGPPTSVMLAVSNQPVIPRGSAGFLPSEGLTDHYFDEPAFPGAAITLTVDPRADMEEGDMLAFALYGACERPEWTATPWDEIYEVEHAAPAANVNNDET